MYLRLNTTIFQRSLRAPLLPDTPQMSLDAAGLVALADLTTIQKRTALTGTAVLLDTLILCPGIHMQQHSTSLNEGEYPACAALTSGYVFRVENPATVFYLQQVSKTAHVTFLDVSKLDKPGSLFTQAAALLFSNNNTSLVGALAYGMAVLWNVSVIILLGFAHDWWGLGVILMLMFSRLSNVIIIRRRATPGWSGAPEPGKKGDLLVLLSQDRWVRIKGDVDHLKAVTSGQWLRDESRVESWIGAVATLVVYLSAALVSNATQFGKILILALLGGSVALLAVSNSTTKHMVMHGHAIKVVRMSNRYDRRLKLAEELINEFGRRDWALRMGMVSDDIDAEEAVQQGPVTM